jgi:hypothetical protein
VCEQQLEGGPRSKPLEQALHTVIANRQALTVADVAKDARFFNYAKLLHALTHTHTRAPAIPTTHAHTHPDTPRPSLPHTHHLLQKPHTAPASFASGLEGGVGGRGGGGGVTLWGGAGRCQYRQRGAEGVGKMGRAERLVLSARTDACAAGGAGGGGGGSRSGGGGGGVSRPRDAAARRRLGFAAPVALVCLPLLERDAAGGGCVVRGVLQVLQRSMLTYAVV